MARGAGAERALERVATRRAGDPYARFARENLRIHYIEDDEQLERALAFLDQLGPQAIALDFETASKNGLYGTSNGSLRLIQVGVSVPEPHQLLIDCHRVDARALRPLFSDPTIEKVIHYSQFEQGWSVAALGTKIEPVFDTCAAAKLISDRLGKLSPEELSELLPNGAWSNNKLRTLVSSLLGIELPKEEQTGDWARPELSAGQLVYAAMDVAILAPLAAPLKQLAARLGCEEQLAEQAKKVANNARDRIARERRTKPDDSQRLAEAINRASGLGELEQIWLDARGMTVRAENVEELEAIYQARQLQLVA